MLNQLYSGHYCRRYIFGQVVAYPQRAGRQGDSHFSHPQGCRQACTLLTFRAPSLTSKAVAAESYAPGTPGDNAENYAQLNNEISLLKSYLPVAPTPEAVQTAIDEIIGGLTAEVRASKGVTGVVIKALWEKLGDARASVDKKDVAKRVTESLK